MCIRDRPNNVPGTLSISEEANDVCCSHEHGDHNYRAGVKLKAVENAPIKITEVSSYHDSEGGVVRGTNTIHVVDTESGLRAVHTVSYTHLYKVPYTGKVLCFYSPRGSGGFLAYGFGAKPAAFRCV